MSRLLWPVTDVSKKIMYEETNFIINCYNSGCYHQLVMHFKTGKNGAKNEDFYFQI